MLPTLIVLHYTAMADAQSALDRLCDPACEVSAHYLIGNDGTVWHLVEEANRAWHAGNGEWRGQDDINSRSIGIELDNTGLHPFSEPQMEVLETLLGEIMVRHGIGPDGVIGHSCMAPGRKSDPGARFDWARLARQGVARMPEHSVEEPPDVSRFRSLAQMAGFTADVSDDALLQVVRLRFRPGANGPLDKTDMAVVKGLV